MNRRSFVKWAIGSSLAVLGLGGATDFYAREMEPFMLQITNQTISSPKIPAEFNNFKIVQFSDTHVGFHYPLDKLAELVQTINEQNPDLIVFTGDLVDNPDEYKWNIELINILKRLQAQHGKYWIYGNHDHGGYGTKVVKKAMDQANLTLLKNEHVIISKGPANITLAGIDDAILGSPDLNKALKGANPEHFTLLLAHEPDFADVTVNYPVDVQLSGHSHGGQVRLPFLGDIYTPALAAKYVQGKFTFNNEAFMLYVTRGIGTTRLPYRFLCKPELYTLTLQSV